MLQKSSTWKVAEFFFINPTQKTYLMDISRRTKLAHTSVKSNLNKLIKSDIIVQSIEKRGNREFPTFRANLNNSKFRIQKRIFNIAKILDSHLINYIEDKLMPNCLVLFGSYSRGEDIEGSDIDIFLECKKEDINLKKFEKLLSRKIELHFNEDFTTFPKELKNNIANGFVLSGFLEVLK